MHRNFNEKLEPIDQDLRRKLMTQEYGNYEKYAKNTVSTKTEPSDTDKGHDTLYENMFDVQSRLKNKDAREYDQKRESDFMRFLRNAKAENPEAIE